MLLRVLTWPFKAPAYWLLVLWTIVGGLLAKMVGWYDAYPVAVGGAIGFSLAAWYGLFGMLAVYGQRLLLHEARGLEDAPIPDVSDVNPFTHGACLGYAFMFLVAVVIVYSVGDRPNWLVVGSAAVLLSLPWLGVNLEGSISDGLRPSTLQRLIKGLKFDLGGHAVLTLIGPGSMAYAIKFNSIVFFALAGYLFLVSQAAMGRLLYHRRAQLDLFTERSPEQLLEFERAEEQHRLDELFNELNAICKTGRVQEAYQRLDEFMRDSYTTLDPQFHERLLLFQDKRLTLEHGVRYLQRLLDRKETKQAWQVFKACLEHDDRFRPFTDEAFIKATRGAGTQDAAQIAELLADFDRAYPDSHLAANAKFRRARVLIELLDDESQGREVLAEIKTEHAEFAQGPLFRNYRK